MEPLTFTLARPDPLGVLTSTAPVVQAGTSVHLDGAAVRRYAHSAAARADPPHAEEALHCTFLPPRRFANYLLALEALNFCFWDEEPRWRVVSGPVCHDGYWALAAALRRALREDAIPLWDARWMAQVTETAMARVLRGEGRPIPLLAARAAHVREAGEVLLARWDGEFANVVNASQGDAVTLVNRIVAEFPSFQDEAIWQDPATGQRRPVKFYKRAQICVADLARLLPDDPLGRMTGLSRLTAFADYKVPQVLRKLGVLVYSEALAAKVDSLQELPAGSPEEVAIRAATIWGCEWIARALNEHAAAGTPAVTAGDVDYRLWLAGQDKTGLRPYHRTRTIFY